MEAVERSFDSLAESGSVVKKAECPVCYDEFTLSDPRLHNLSCGHHLCTGCASLLDSNRMSFRKCPLCRREAKDIDVITKDLIDRRGFFCHTCKLRAMSDKLRVCVTCSEDSGFMLRPDMIRQMGPFIYCSDCFVEDHMEKGHRQEKLINYDDVYYTLKGLRVSSQALGNLVDSTKGGEEERMMNYKIMETVSRLVASEEADMCFEDLKTVQANVALAIDVMKVDVENHRKLTKICSTIEKELTKNIDKNQDEVCLSRFDHEYIDNMWTVSPKRWDRLEMRVSEEVWLSAVGIYGSRSVEDVRVHLRILDHNKQLVHDFQKTVQCDGTFIPIRIGLPRKLKMSPNVWYLFELMMDNGKCDGENVHFSTHYGRNGLAIYENFTSSVSAWFSKWEGKNNGTSISQGQFPTFYFADEK